MIRLSFSIELRYEVVGPRPTSCSTCHAAHTPWQAIVIEVLTINPPLAHRLHTDPVLGNRYLSLRAGPGPLSVRYDATVDINHHRTAPATLEEVPVATSRRRSCPTSIPAATASPTGCGAWPRASSATCARLLARAGDPGLGAHAHRFTSAAPTAAPRPIDTLVEQVGVCRDFAHLMIALCRAVNIPARFVTGIDYGAAVELGRPTSTPTSRCTSATAGTSSTRPGSRPHGPVRIGTGRDAADVSFATMFGDVRSQAPIITVVARDDPANGYQLPHHSKEALSTSAEARTPCRWQPSRP
jgi:hypothetical protein